VAAWKFLDAIASTTTTSSITAGVAFVAVVVRTMDVSIGTFGSFANLRVLLFLLLLCLYEMMIRKFGTRMNFHNVQTNATPFVFFLKIINICIGKQQIQLRAHELLLSMPFAFA